MLFILSSATQSFSNVKELWPLIICRKKNTTRGKHGQNFGKNITSIKMKRTLLQPLNTWTLPAPLEFPISRLWKYIYSQDDVMNVNCSHICRLLWTKPQDLDPDTRLRCVVIFFPQICFSSVVEGLLCWSWWISLDRVKISPCFPKKPENLRNVQRQEYHRFIWKQTK